MGLKEYVFKIHIPKGKKFLRQKVFAEEIFARKFFRELAPNSRKEIPKNLSKVPELRKFLPQNKSKIAIRQN